MKDKINRILTKHIHAESHSEINLHTVHGIIPATDELTALMCYREVRAYYQAYRDFDDNESDESIKQEILGTFSDDYPEEIILQAIKQVKNEQT